jgi:ubiquinone/menaquinone biosynthesis C-methylase UbiE
MTDHFQQIYQHHAATYERLVSREDWHGNLFAALEEIAAPSGKLIVDLGTGTGRVTRLLSVLARHIIACDASPHMLETARASLTITGMRNYTLLTADHRALPLPTGFADVVVQGWSFAHAVSWYPHTWQTEVARMLSEAQRILKPNGTLILIETLGTGNKQPQPPTAGLAALYAWWQQTYGLQQRWLRTDYQFASVSEAAELTRFFFGDALAERVLTEQLEILPECTGLWWKTYSTDKS